MNTVRYIFLVSILLFSGTTYSAHAQELRACDLENTTVVYVNGILTTQEQAEADKVNLREQYAARFETSGVHFDFAHNPSRLAGAGDLAKAAQQARRSEDETPIHDHDLEVMLNQLHEQLTTQKVVLVGHSQGGFYVNQLYEYLVNNGIPESAIGVYHTGTPASFVAGGENTYTTSATDEVINYVRELTAAGNAHAPLEANIVFSLTPEEHAQEWAGHSFADIYLTYGNTRIIVDVYDTLTTLESTPTDITDGCFTPPGRDAGYYTRAALFTVTEPIAERVVPAIRTAAQATGALVRTIQEAVAQVVGGSTSGNAEDSAQPPATDTPIQTLAPISRSAIGEPIPSAPRPQRNLGELQAQLTQASALVALLELDIRALHEAREQECIARSIRGPWDNYWWRGDKPGCDDPTPRVTKLYWAPIQGVGGIPDTESTEYAGALTATITTDPAPDTLSFFTLVDVVWNSTGATACTVTTPRWTLEGTSGRKPYGPAASGDVFSIECTDGSRTAADTLTIAIDGEPWEEF